MHFVHSQSIVKHAIKKDYTGTLETLEDFWMTLSWRSELLIGAPAILYPLVKVSIPWNCSWFSTRCLVHSQSIIKHAIYMDYTITLETLESFWMAFSRCFEHRVGAWAILYPLVKVSSPWNCSEKSRRRLVYSESIITHSI